MILEKITDEFVKRSAEILKDGLCGVYLHGSSVMGCFNPEKSDIDLIIVVNSHLTDETKRALLDMTVELNSISTPKGIEMSIVKKDVCKPFVYPTPYELHFSAGHLEWYEEDPDEYIREMNGVDKDLAAHFSVIRARGKCLYGLPIDEVFGEVPKADYMDSLWFDISDARKDMVEHPTYMILNLARVLTYCRENAVLSKKEGGEWAVKNLPAEFHPLIMAALEEYTKGKNAAYDREISARYAKYMLNQIKKYKNRRLT